MAQFECAALDYFRDGCAFGAADVKRSYATASIVTVSCSV